MSNHLSVQFLLHNLKRSANKEDTEQGGSGKTVDESILGSPEEISEALEKNYCFGIPIPCPMLAVGVGAAIVLLVSMR